MSIIIYPFICPSIYLSVCSKPVILKVTLLTPKWTLMQRESILNSLQRGAVIEVTKEFH